MSTSYEVLLTELAHEVGLPAAALLATEEIDIDGLSIGLQLEGEGPQAEVLLCCLLASPRADQWTATARAMLQANHLWSGTGGATLGMLPDDDRVSLSARRLLRDLDADKLAVLLAHTVDMGHAWQDFIVQGQGSALLAPFFPAASGLRG
ncbi:MAG: CesT family type III secretion system chaperone [Comamonas sp.]